MLAMWGASFALTSPRQMAEAREGDAPPER
jgi:hypothetical protein